MRRHGEDPTDVDRQLATVFPTDPEVVEGLGETGNAADRAVIAASLEHPLSRGRVAAVRALRRLGFVTPATVEAMLSDPSAEVTRQVVAALRATARDLDEDGLRLRLDGGTASPHAGRGVRALLRERDVWSRLLTDLQLLDDAQDSIRLRATSDLGLWLDRHAARTYSTPAGDMKGLREELLVVRQPVLGDTCTRLLRLHMGLRR